MLEWHTGMVFDTEEAERFHKALRETGAYRTDLKKPHSLADRLLGRFDSWYYLRLGLIIYQGHRIALQGKYDTLQWAAHSFKLLSIIEACGGKIEISGLEHSLRDGRPTVYTGNHMSMAEAFLLPVVLTHINHFAPVVKESLTRYPCVGTFVNAVAPIKVGRKNPREDLKTVLRQGTEFLKNGRSVVLFPQSTRSYDFDPKAFNTLGVKLAKSAGVPVTPLALKTDFIRVGRFIKDIGSLDRSKTLYFKFGRPIDVEGNGRAAQEELVRFIGDNLKEWKKA